MMQTINYTQNVVEKLVPDHFLKNQNWAYLCIDGLKFYNPLSANFTKCSNTFKQFVGNMPTNCLSVFDHFVGLALKGIKFVFTVCSSQGLPKY